jgi:hypothetical protein
MRHAIALFLFASGCGSAPVTLGEEWPERAPDYDDAYQRWTRHDEDYRDVDLAIDATATLKAPEWRAAYAAAKARQAKLVDRARTELFEAERSAMAEFWEIELLVSTHDFVVNDFSSKEKSVWRMRLVGDDGREVAPVSVKLDERPRSEIALWFPALTPFHKAYVMRFPKVAADGQPLVTGESRKLELRIGSSLGAIKLTWAR